MYQITGYNIRRLKVLKDMFTWDAGKEEETKGKKKDLVI